MDEWRKWILGIGVAAGVAGVLRLYLSVTATVLGTSVSCGNAIGYLTGGDNRHPTALAVCGSALRNASAEGIMLVVAGVVAIVVSRNGAVMKGRMVHYVNKGWYPPMSQYAPPGWYETRRRGPGYYWWDGERWAGTPAAEAPRRETPGGRTVPDRPPHP